MGRLRSWLASWQIVYRRSSPLCTRCIACWFVHRLTSLGISVYVCDCLCVSLCVCVCVYACVCVCVCVCVRGWVMSGRMCVAVWFVMLFMQSICSRFDSCVSSGRQKRRTFFIFKSPQLCGSSSSPCTQSTYIYSFILSLSLSLSRSLTLSLSLCVCLSLSCLSQSRR